MTVSTADVAVVLGPLIGRPLLTPREANTLTFRLVELTMDAPCETDTLKLLARYLSTTAYGDLVVERNANGVCGYPCCAVRSGDIRACVGAAGGASRLNLPSAYKSSYCSKQHLQCSHFYAAQLSEEALFMRTHLDAPWFGEDAPESNVRLLDEHLDTVVSGLEGVAI